MWVKVRHDLLLFTRDHIHIMDQGPTDEAGVGISKLALFLRRLFFPVICQLRSKWEGKSVCPRLNKCSISREDRYLSSSRWLVNESTGMDNMGNLTRHKSNVSASNWGTF